MVKSAGSLDDTSPALLWLVVYPPTPLKNDGLKVSWDDDFHSQDDGKVIKKSMVPVTTNQLLLKSQIP